MNPFRNAECACQPPQRGRRGLRNGPTLTLVLALALGTLAAPLPADAQQPAKISRIGILRPGAPPDPLVEAFRQGLHELGYAEGRDIIIEYRWAEGKEERLTDLAAELVRLKVDVIVVSATRGPLAAKQATTTIPIVMAASGDPVAAGLVASLARPGGNVTGLSVISPELSGKRLELLKGVVPKLSRVAVLWDADPGNPFPRLVLKEMEIAAAALRVQLQLLGIREPKELDGAFEAATRGRAGGVVVVGGPLTIANRMQIVILAAKHRLPVMYGLKEFVEAGGLISYGPNHSDLYRRAAVYVDKILKGAKPADLPVEQPTRFELVINLKTAKALGLTIPQSVLIRADEVIQ